MLGRRLLIGTVVASLTTSIAVACGPDFPSQLLENRAETLKAPPANSFAFEAAHLVPPPKDSLKAIEPEYSWYEDEQARQEQDANLEKAEAVGLSDDQVKLIRRMRRALQDEEAFAQGKNLLPPAAFSGEGLPMAVRLYTAGAIDFRLKSFPAAETRFQAVLDLPESDRPSRAVWAAYMLGRSYALQGNPEKAARAFAAARDFAIHDAPDPLGLAVASYGEEAKLHLKRANDELVGDQLPESADASAYARELGTAVTLYAEQAARGSNSGVQSLRIVVEQLLDSNQEHRLVAAAADPIVERLLVVYALARINDIPPWRENTDGSQKRRTSPDPPLITFLDVIANLHRSDSPEGVDRLAALAYRAGRYDLAARFAEQSSGAIASWVKAKLALQKGNLAAAAGFYAEASRAFPPAAQERYLDPDNARLIIGESGVLSLARGEYVDALDKLYPVASRYWGDVAYIAERVLTADELKAFVDAKVAMPTPLPSALPPTVDEAYYWRFAIAPATAIRDLLARRLVREGRYAEALPYFHAGADTRFSDPDVAKDVTEYAAALHDASSGWWSLRKARGWYQAAVLARHSGMEMMGYEGPPDEYALNGEFDWGVGHNTPTGLYVTDGELQRDASSAAKPPFRYHYRFIAVDEASHAADLLPPRSEAFAAVLCKATGWMLSTPGTSSHVAQLYSRYVKQGPLVPWATHFGWSCPEPDFDGAARLVWLQPLCDIRHFASRHRWLIGVGVVVIGGLTGLLLARRHRPSIPGS